MRVDYDGRHVTKRIFYAVGFTAGIMYEPDELAEMADRDEFDSFLSSAYYADIEDYLVQVLSETDATPADLQKDLWAGFSTARNL